METGEKIVIGALLAAMALLVGLLWWAVASYAAATEAFMAECQQHRPRYECVAMWGDANSG